MTKNEQLGFIYGYAYRLAEEAKADGSFSDMTIKELASVFIQYGLDAYMKKHVEAYKT